MRNEHLGKSRSCKQFFAFQAIATNKVLSRSGLKYAREIAQMLQDKGVGVMEQDGAQSYFVITENVSREIIEGLDISYQVCR